MIDPNKTISTLVKGPLFKGIDPALLQPALESLTVEHWHRRHIVLTPHQSADRFYIVLKGRVKIFLHNTSGRELTLFLLGPGDAFDLGSLLDGQKSGMFAQTLDEADALSGPVELWREWIDATPALRIAFRRYMDQRLQRMAELAGDLALHDTMTRLTHLILRYFDDKEILPIGAPNLIEDLSHEELASMIGTVRVVINRLLTELKREGIVNTNDGKLHVLNLHKLLQKAEQHAHSTSSGVSTH